MNSTPEWRRRSTRGDAAWLLGAAAPREALAAKPAGVTGREAPIALITGVVAAPACRRSARPDDADVTHVALIEKTGKFVGKTGGVTSSGHHRQHQVASVFFQRKFSRASQRGAGFTCATCRAMDSARGKQPEAAPLGFSAARSTLRRRACRGGAAVTDAAVSGVNEHSIKFLTTAEDTGHRGQPRTSVIVFRRKFMGSTEPGGITMFAARGVNNTGVEGQRTATSVAAAAPQPLQGGAPAVAPLVVVGSGGTASQRRCGCTESRQVDGPAGRSGSRLLDLYNRSRGPMVVGPTSIRSPGVRQADLVTAGRLVNVQDRVSSNAHPRARKPSQPPPRARRPRSASDQ